MAKHERGDPAREDTERTRGAEAGKVTDHGIEEDFGFVPRFMVLETNASYSHLCEAVANTPSVSLDFPALNVFFRAGLFLNGRSPFREIRRYAPTPVIVPPVDMLREAAIDAYIDLFRQAVRRRVQPDSVLALSGGCDSRHILLELKSQKQLPKYALTVAIPGRPSEVENAVGLARRVGIQHVVHVPEPLRATQDEAWKNQACDFMSIEHGWLASVGRQRDSQAWWDGIGGDILSAGLFLEQWNL